MPLNLCIFEDDHYHRLYPLSLTRPVFELRCGLSLLREKIARRFPHAHLYFFCRNYLAALLHEIVPEAVANETPSGECLFINGRFILGEKLPACSGPERVWKLGGEVAAALISTTSRLAALAHFDQGVIPTKWFETLPAEEIDGTFIRYPWDLVQHNPAQIKSDFASFGHGGQILGKIYPQVTLLDERNIFVAAGAKIKPGAVLDAEDGPIYIDAGATVMANAALQGPLGIGANTVVKMGAKIYEGTTLGPRCKVGGEVEESIIHGYSNKQHEGFLGHAYLGEWVNLGADTNNSDLKNNYSSVKVYVDGKMIDSGSLFAGLFMGDHAKCGINTMFNTGTVAGVMSNIFGAGYPDKFVPSFCWGGVESLETYALDQALETARRVMARRQKVLTRAQEEVLRHVFALTQNERVVMDNQRGKFKT